MSTRTILDTGPLVALLNRRDRYHAWTVRVLGGLPPPLWTCEAVLMEASHLTRQPLRITKMLAAGVVKIGIHAQDESEALAALLERYGQRMDFADACVVRMSELHKRSVVLTLDRRDFTTYRRNGREVIPLLAPEAGA